MFISQKIKASIIAFVCLLIIGIIILALVYQDYIEQNSGFIVIMSILVLMSIFFGFTVYYNITENQREYEKNFKKWQQIFKSNVLYEYYDCRIKNKMKKDKIPPGVGVKIDGHWFETF